MIAGAETMAREMERTNPNEANVFRIVCSNTIQRAERPASNLDSEQRRALKTLQDNQALSILMADKGGKTVVLDTNQYTLMCLAHLECDAYELVDSFAVGRRTIVLRNKEGEVAEFIGEDFQALDPSDELVKVQCRCLTNMLTRFRDNGSISATDRSRTIPSQPFSGNIPQLYGLPKIHKIGVLKIRPIVANTDIYCDKLLLHLKAILNCLFDSEFAVLNSYDFVERLDALTITPKDRLASLDVESLYTKVPVDQTLQVVRRRLMKMWSSEDGKEELAEITSLKPDAFMELLNFVMQDFYFCYAKKLYWQKSGLPMGNRLSPVLANIYMEEMEIAVLERFPVQPKMYTRFVDDIFLIYDCTEFHLTKFLDLFNAQHPDIRLTLERENEHKQLAFLDLLIERVNKNEEFDRTVQDIEELDSEQGNQSETDALMEQSQTMDNCMDDSMDRIQVENDSENRSLNVDGSMDRPQNVDTSMDESGNRIRVANGSKNRTVNNLQNVDISMDGFVD